MNSLLARTRKYYFLAGLKLFGYVAAVQLLLVVEWTFFGVEEEDIVGFVSQNVITFNAMFMVLFNMLFAIYGPNWYDSMVLSMGARRRDVFWGQLIKQSVFVGLSAILSIVLCVVFKHENFLGYTIVAVAAAMILGALGLVIGYKVKKYGKIVIFGLLIIVGVQAGIWGFVLATGIKLPIGSLNSAMILSLIGAGAVAVFVLLEFWAYRLNQKCMVS
ncbi:hypothetical protein NXH64_05590 [Butyrivibrio fibrisolvens]|uniref:hypothetical protein n=1 Tax=Pseudobutyrivibrio ruminis TaxID=46206 RepID=UPI000412D872|nr:hypothetical protein [Pseudobutyrivibrio ruminis]MDC7278976.1 hypothetical protein [Butyrivibrio fibrisolvens]